VVQVHPGPPFKPMLPMCRVAHNKYAAISTFPVCAHSSSKAVLPKICQKFEQIQVPSC
jgi:hypothetical protein